ncbi:MAG TPA: lytic transglycosylase domain-containing protein [Thermoleophilaceae bacterium]|jgi:soluble lytic murein transglycosylase
MAAAVRRRRYALAAVFAGVVTVLVVMAVQVGPHAVKELTLPLKHEDIIRQQAEDKGLDPALIAAVIYQESKFRDRTSSAGAKGLMQLLPGTAEFIAHKSGGTAFELQDLGTPQINIAYGSWYLRYLIGRYNGNQVLAIAAYNAGEDNVDKWVAKAGGPASFDVNEDIPFPETRAYVQGVLSKRSDYAKNYAKELGLTH